MRGGFKILIPTRHRRQSHYAPHKSSPVISVLDAMRPANPQTLSAGSALGDTR
jgi:hypothetical protein